MESRSGTNRKSRGSGFVALVGLCAAAIGSPAVPAPEAGSAQPWTLEGCIRTALEKHGDTLAATEEVKAASAQLRAAGSALYYPQLSAETSRTEGRTETRDETGTTSEQQNWLHLTVTLWDGGIQRQNVRKARATEQSAGAALQSTRNTLAYDVTGAYLGLLRARHTVQVAEEKLRQAEAQKGMVQAKIKAGAAAEVDVYPVDVQIASARVEQIKAAGDVRGAGTLLRNTMGLEPGGVPEVADLPEQLSGVPGLEECLRRAAAHRPELHQAHAAVEQQRANLDLARLKLRPQISAGGSLDRGLGNTSILNEWRAFATLSWSFYHRADRANFAAAKASVSGAAAQEQQRAKDVAAEVEQAHIALSSAREQIAAAESSVAMARKNLEVAEARYQQGLAIPIEIVDAQVAFSNARLQAIDARYDYLLARAQLDRAIGAAVME